jgi:glyoxylase I family protein
MVSITEETMHRATLCLLSLLIGGCMTHARPAPSAKSAVIRYQVSDIGKSIDFYTQKLGFQLVQQSGSAFASVSRGDLTLVLSGPGASGSRPMPDGRRQEPGGWNRMILYVDDLGARIEALRGAGVIFRNQVESGPGGTQILVDDPDGNPIELHEPPRSG